MEFQDLFKDYYNVKIINLKKEFTQEELNILERLEIKIEDKQYTEYELNIVEMKLLYYYKDEEKNYIYPLKNGVNETQYDMVFNKFQEIIKKYNNLFQDWSFYKFV